MKIRRLSFFAIFGLGIFTIAVAILFSFSISDAINWKKQLDLSIVNPSYYETDLTKLKTVTDFTVKDRKQKPVRLSDFSSVDILVINIWSTGCPACEREMPSLMEMDRRFENSTKLALLTITIDEKWDDVAHLLNHNQQLRVFFDPQQKVTKDILGTERYPETFVLDKDRRIRARFDGEREWHSSAMMKFLLSLGSN